MRIASALPFAVKKGLQADFFDTLNPPVLPVDERICKKRAIPAQTAWFARNVRESWLSDDSLVWP